LKKVAVNLEAQIQIQVSFITLLMIYKLFQCCLSDIPDVTLRNTWLAEMFDKIWNVDPVQPSTVHGYTEWKLLPKALNDTAPPSMSPDALSSVRKN
jgi:hypothetical protein